VLTVVVPTRDAADVLPGQLRALSEQGPGEPFEVIVADNGSTDGTAGVVASWRAELPALRLVDASGRAGVSHARNVGVAAASGRNVLFCDADDEVAPDWVAAMSAALEQAAVVGGRLDRRRLTPASQLREGHVVSDGLTPWPGFLPFASGASLGIRTEVLRALGGFDETYVMGADDVELSWRAQLAGHRLAFAGDAVVHYRERVGVRPIGRQTFAYGVQDPHLYRQFAPHGMPGSGVGTALRSWAHLFVRAPRYAATAPDRSQWVRSAARRTGRLVGSVRYRTLYL